MRSQTDPKEAHMYKWELRKNNISLTQLKKLLGGTPCQATLSRRLSGVLNMPLDLEKKIGEILKKAEKEWI
jgi:hypothetical protein